MSLKFFHVVFIAASVLLAIGLGFWSIDAWRTTGQAGWLLLATVSLTSGAALVVYANRFLQKTRKFGIAALLMAGSLALPADALACPVCMGNTDSLLGTGVNMGVLVLLGAIGSLLVGFALFFLYLARRARATGAGTDAVFASRAGSEFSVRTQEGSI